MPACSNLSPTTTDRHHEIERVESLQKLFIENYSNNNFQIVKTCKAIGISRDVFYVWLKKYPAFKQAIADHRDNIIDQAQDVLMEIMSNSPFENLRLDAAKFVLKTLGSKKGYGDPNEEAPIKQISINIIRRIDGATDANIIE